MSSDDGTLGAGAGGLPELMLVASDGAVAEIYLYGGQTVSWIPAGGTERLFLSARARFAAGTPIRGGVPIIFPQFDREGPLPRHGFARVSEWELVDVRKQPQSAEATLRLTDSAATRSIWPHAFTVDLTVRIGGPELLLSLAVQNTGASDFTFTGALHSYLRVAHIAQTAVEGLAGVRYRDRLDGAMHEQRESELRISSEVDRVYANAPDCVVVRERNRATRVQKGGFPDIVVWNPSEAGAELPDLEPLGHLHMLCVEAAVVSTPVRLAPAQTWAGTQLLCEAGDPAATK